MDLHGQNTTLTSGMRLRLQLVARQTLRTAYGAMVIPCPPPQAVLSLGKVG